METAGGKERSSSGGGSSGEGHLGSVAEVACATDCAVFGGGEVVGGGAGGAGQCVAVGACGVVGGVKGGGGSSRGGSGLRLFLCVPEGAAAALRGSPVLRQLVPGARFH